MTQTKPRAYKNFTPKMGIYALRHPASNLTLLDFSPHVEGGINRVRFQLEAGVYSNKEVQQLWKTQGPDAIQLEILDELEYNPSKPSDHDYSAELFDLEALAVA